ncbi:arsenate reductase family protein [Paenibacillus sp. KQZ6P-2]|uniref:Arsenate reductase family protein n=1 Tax=Paenibacillus mangrovi TaxID=2931978 RepID=A0A9X1WRG7_9BACL|nr:arsenate reductase family protein [Paenibacillus mangrovi]MCJ8013346.1 arsenate reductase family protein [Paenibacillus mangrovi]
MSKLQVYQYPKCGTCRSAVKWLQAHGHELELHHIMEEPPKPEVLANLVKLSGLPLKKFFNTSGEVYKELGLKDKLSSIDEEEQIKLLSSNGKLIKRPLVTDGSKVTVGFKEDLYESAWG